LQAFGLPWCVVRGAWCVQNQMASSYRRFLESRSEAGKRFVDLISGDRQRWRESNGVGADGVDNQTAIASGFSHGSGPIAVEHCGQQQAPAPHLNNPFEILETGPKLLGPLPTVGEEVAFLDLIEDSQGRCANDRAPTEGSGVIARLESFGDLVRG
jgi:hypothetical protein